MSLPTTGIRLNKTTPAPPTDQQNIVFQSDGATPQQDVSGYDPIMVGDTGSGGKAGNVPAPAAGDAAAGKFLKADGTYQVPPGGGGGGGGGSSNTHSESLTDGNANFIFAATLSKGGDIITVVGVPN
jgi:hypothetical protein